MARILIPDLQPGARYAIQLRSNDGEAVSQWSNIYYIDVETGAVAPEGVTGLVWEAVGTSFHGSWTPPLFNTDDTPLKDFYYYEVVVSAGSSSARYTILDKDNPQFTLTFDENVAVFGDAEPVVTITVRVVNRSFVKSQPVELTAINPQPDSPVGLDAEAFTNQIVLEWGASPSEDVVAYKVYQGLDAGFTISDVNEVWVGAALTATHHSTAYNTDHYYKVTAVDAFGTESAPVAEGPIRPLGIVGSVDTTPPDNPTGVTASAAANSDPSGQFADLTVSWTGPTPASDTSLSHFNVRYGSVGAWNYVQVPRDELSVKISKILAGSNVNVEVQAVDYTANDSAWVSANSGAVVVLPKDTTFIETPAAPTVAVGTMRAQVSHNLNASPSGTLPADLDYFEVYASTTTNFTPSTTNMLGTMKVNVVAIETFDLPATAASGTAQTWYFKVRAVDRAGNKSPYSSQTTGSISLIATANIGDAQITNAKINTVEANKITAGTGIITDLTVKSKLTLGDASTTGAIETFGYVAGSTGARFDKNTIEINNGSIAAAALRLQVGPNLVPMHYAGFEYITGHYTEKNAIHKESASLVLALDTVSPKFEAQSLKVSFTGTPVAQGVELAPDTDTYNIPVEPGDHIYSLWVRNSLATTFTLNLRITASDGSNLVVSGGNALTQVPASSGWTQRYGKFTVPSGIKYVRAGWFTVAQASGDYNVDGVMVERQTSTTVVPSEWKPGGFTKIVGGIIETNAIKTEMLDSQVIKTRHLDSESIISDHLQSDMVLTKRILLHNFDDSGNISGNQIQLSPDGIMLGAVTGLGEFSPSIILPTAVGQTALFTGSVITDEISVINGATLRSKANELARGAELTLSGGTTKPSAAPQPTFSYENHDFNLFSDEEAYGLCKGHDGRWYTYVQERGSFTSDIILAKTIGNPTPIVALNKTDGLFPEGGIVYSALYNRYYMLSRRASDGAWRFETYDTSFTKIADNSFQPAFTTPQWNKYGLGYDFVNNKLLVMAGDPASNTLRVWVYSISATGVGANDMIFNDTGTYQHPMSSVMMLSADFGAQRMVYAGRTAGGLIQVRSTNLATSYNANWAWEVAGNSPTAGMWWDGTTHNDSNGRFWMLGTDGVMRKYEGGSHNWDSTVTSSMWFIANNYRDINTNVAEGLLATHQALGGVHATCGGLHETDLGTKKSFTMKKRARLDITANGLPNYNLQNDPAYPNGLGSDDPNAYGFWVGRPSTLAGTTVTNAEMKLAAQPAAGVIKVTLTNVDFGAATNAGSLVNTFPPAEAAEIKSLKMRQNGTTPVLSFDADGLGNLEKLHIYSDTGANANSGNRPGLIIGHEDANHLRVDVDSLYAMDSDTVQGNLLLNPGGGTKIGGSGSSAIKGIKWGSENVSINASGVASVNHAMGLTPVLVLINAEASGTYVTPNVASYGNNNFNMTFRDISTHALLSNTTRNVSWLAIY